MNKKELLTHVVLFTIVFIGITFYLFYQVIVATSYANLGLKNFLKPKTLIAALKELPADRSEYKQDLLFFDSSNSLENISEKTVFQPSEIISNKEIYKVGDENYLVYFQKSQLYITNLKSRSTEKIELPVAESYSVLGWQNKNTLLVFSYSDRYTLLRVTTDTKNIETLVSDISFPSSLKKFHIPSFFNEVVYPDCKPNCYFIVYDLSKNAETQKIPAFADASHQATFTNIELLFFDTKEHIIGYSIPERKEAYVIDNQLNLLQFVRLENERNTVSYQGYFPETAQIAFLLTEKNNLKNTLVLYSAKKPSLEILSNYTEDQLPIISPQANSYAIAEFVFSSNGEKVFSSKEKRLIPVY